MINNDLTISTLSFKLKANDIADGSLRTEVSRGVNLPEVLTIRSQDYVDSATKLPGTRTVLRIDRHLALASGQIAPGSYAYLVVGRLKDSGVVTADITAVVARIRGVIDDTAPNLNLSNDIFVDGAQ